MIGCFRLVILFICLNPIADLIGQQQGSFSTWSRKEGLSSNFVYCIANDAQGYLWIGTNNGLNRFDGYRFTVFRHQGDQLESISGNQISCIYEDRADRLWIGTNHGLNLLQQDEGSFKHILLDSTKLSNIEVSALHQSDDGYLWIGTFGQGVYRLTLDNADQAQHIKHFPHDKRGDPSRVNPRINRILQDVNGKLLLGTSLGLDRLDPASGALEHFGPEGQVRDIVPWGEGTYLYSLSIHGVYVLQQDDSVVELDLSLKHPQDQAAADAIASSNIHDLLVTPERNIWIATDVGTFLKRDSVSPLIHFQHQPFDRLTLPNNDVASLHQDEHGVIWVGSYGGISLWRGLEIPFEFHTHNPDNAGSVTEGLVRTIMEDDQGNLWLAIMGKGLDKLTHMPAAGWTKTMHIRSKQFTDKGLQIESVWSMSKGHDGHIWITGDKANGINKLNPLTGTFAYFLPRPSQDHGLQTSRIGKVFHDSDGSLWLGNLGAMGLSRYFPQSDSAVHYRYSAQAGQGISSDRIHIISEDKVGFVWIGTWRGLNRFDKVKGTFTQFLHDPSNHTTLSDNRVITIFPDENDNLWVGTDLGLNLYNYTDQTFQRFTDDKDFLNARILGITQDQKGYLWVFTDERLLRIDANSFLTNRSQSLGNFLMAFDEKDGIGGDTFWPNTFFRSQKTGNIYFGTSNGFNVIHPDFVLADTSTSTLKLSSMTRYRSGSQGSSEITDYFVSSKEQIVLDRFDKVISIQISDLNYATPSRRSYEYMLSGLHDHWLPVVDQVFTFSNLPEGDYDLLLRSTHKSTSSHTNMLNIQVIPPWWFSRVAFAVYALLFVLLLYLIRRFELNRRHLLQQAEISRTRAEEKQRQAHVLIKKNEEILKVQNQLIQQEKMASLGQMTAGIAHEIKNPLNFVTNFAEGSIEILDDIETILDEDGHEVSLEELEELRSLSRDLRQNAEDIKENGSRADRIVQSMMHHARGQVGEVRPIDVNLLLKENVNLAYQGFRASSPGFHVQIEMAYDEGIPPMLIHGQEMGRVFLNLVNNSCYALHRKYQENDPKYRPKLRIATAQTESHLIIKIEDNGIGIPSHLLAQIFDPFFTTKPTGQGNTGLGLSLSYDIVVKMHKGELKVHSEEGEFTEFLIKLPMQINHQS